MSAPDKKTSKKRHKKSAAATPTLKRQLQSKLRSQNKALQHIRNQLELRNEALLRAQTEIEEGLQSYAALYDLAPLGYMTLDTRGRIMQINITGSILLGYARPEAARQPFSQFLNDKDDRALFQKHLESCQSSGSNVITDLHLACHGMQTVRQVQIISIPKGSEKARRFLTAIIDLTERKQAEKAVRESEERLAGIVASAMDAIITVDAGQRILLFNKAAERMFHCPAEKAVGTDIGLFIPQQFRQRHEQHIKRFGRTGETSRAMGSLGAISGRRADGEEFPIEASISKTEIAGHQLFTVILRDITDRIRAKEALAASEQRFRVIMDCAPVLVWVSDTTKLCTWFNKPWLEFVGRTMELELGNGWAENVHPDDLDRCLTIYTTAFDARVPFEMSYRLRRHDGEYRWLLDKGIPLHGSAQEFTGYIGSCVDITDRKIAEAAVRAKEAQLWLITQNTPVMLTQCSRNLTYTFANRACANMLRLEPEEIIGRPIIEVLGSAAFELIRPHIEQVLQGRRVEYEAEIPYPQSGRRTVHVVYVPDTDALGGVTGWLASITDITERRMIENELQRERAFLRQVIDATPSMIFVKDREGRFLLGNEALARSCGTTVENLTGKTDASFHRTPEQIAHFQKIDHEIMSSGKALRTPEEEITQADGQVRWFSTGKVPLFNDDGTCDKVLGVATDITERRQALQRLEHAKAELEQRVAERTSELLAQMDERTRLENALLDISEQEQRRLGQDLHDGLCQSLSGLAFMARSLMKTLEERNLAEPTAKAARLADLIHQSVEQARGIARGLHPVVMDAEGLVSALRELAAQSNGEVSCRLRCERMVPIADNMTALHLYRIAQEAVANALKHARARTITLSLRLWQNLLTLSVADDGHGLADPVQTGNGMGLRLMRYRADVIGGNFSIQRRKLRGTRMTCSLRMPDADPYQPQTLAREQGKR
ncbi:PAS domain S-box protein [Prosthecobacter sp.]|uniref:sensor histidine kinase n=1 Tax=Prosthecobacter sp. TaxID=1965333 RepID=UPI002ABA457C|nr:PAS domain S-box protein [Prosthecobacter sp.]MDZ4405384.1 PAS domain S-box protein [Prosthecobacter sp.]